jgi:hypothetical protein
MKSVRNTVGVEGQATSTFDLFLATTLDAVMVLGRFFDPLLGSIVVRLIDRRIYNQTSQIYLLGRHLLYRVVHRLPPGLLQQVWKKTYTFLRHTIRINSHLSQGQQPWLGGEIEV